MIYFLAQNYLICGDFQVFQDNGNYPIRSKGVSVTGESFFEIHFAEETVQTGPLSLRAPRCPYCFNGLHIL